MQSKAKTIAEYLKSLPPERREGVTLVYKTMKARMPKGFAEAMMYGMPGWVVPLKTYPQGYLDKPDMPLPYVGFMSQKRHIAVYLTTVYAEPGDNARFRKAWAKSGKKLNMGKSCIRCTKVEDLALDVIGDEVASMSVEKVIALYEKGRKGAKPAKKKKA